MPAPATDYPERAREGDEGSAARRRPRLRRDAPASICGRSTSCRATGEFGDETWLNDSWTYSGNSGAWSLLSADEELGYVYLPIEEATGDYYGGTRPGNNLFAESIVCLDAKTGKRVWHFQTLHHGLWDYDLPAAPILADITVNGRTDQGARAGHKQAYVYVLDRVERASRCGRSKSGRCRRANVPGEWYSPTQPIPDQAAGVRSAGRRPRRI